MKAKQPTYLEKFDEAVRKQQIVIIKQFLGRFNNSLTDMAIHNLANSLASGRCDQRGCGYYQPYLNTALSAMKEEVCY